MIIYWKAIPKCDTDNVKRIGCPNALTQGARRLLIILGGKSKQIEEEIDSKDECKYGQLLNHVWWLYLSSSIAEPSSNNSSTDPTAESLLVALFVPFRDLLPKKELRKLCFFFGVWGKIRLLDGIISTTKQVVSSFSPLDRSASWIINNNNKKANCVVGHN